MIQFIAGKVEELKKIANYLIQNFVQEQEKVYAFYGEMGSGKTTLIKELCNVLEIETPSNSPTFTIVNEYITKSKEKIYHIDLYRIEKKEELIGIGIEDYLYSNNYCFIEWPEILEDLLPPNCIKVYIEIEDKTLNRKYTIKKQ